MWGSVVNVAEANALLERMAYGVPYYLGYCVCSDYRRPDEYGRPGRPHGKVGGLGCPFTPLDPRTSDDGVFDALLVRFGAWQFDGAGVCRACYAMLRADGPSLIPFDECLATHRPWCAVRAVLEEARRLRETSANELEPRSGTS